MERINLTDADVHNFIADKNWGENTKRQNEWRINQIINTNDFNNVKKYSWFSGLYKHLKMFADKKKIGLDNDVKVINLQKELEIYKMKMSVDEIDKMNQLLSNINIINNIGKEEVIEVKREENEDYDRIRKKYLKEKRVREEEELQHNVEKDKLLVKVEKYQQLAIKYQKLYEELLLSTQNQEKKTYSSDEDENCGYGN